MNKNLAPRETLSPFIQWIAGWRLVALTAFVLTIWALVLVTQRDGDVDSIRLLIRITARVSLGLFCLAFSATAASRIWPNRWTRWQLANRRYLGLSFAVSHFIHAVALSIFIGRYAVQFHEVHPGSNVPGGIGYLFLLAMTVTSFDRTAAFVGVGVWKALHATGAYVLWTIFLISEVSRVHEGRIHLWFVAPLLLVAAIRILAWWRARAVATRQNAGLIGVKAKLTAAWRLLRPKVSNLALSKFASRSKVLPAIFASLVLGACVAEQGNKESSAAPSARRLPDEGGLPGFRGATTWLNSPPLTADGLRGKVVLVDFGTYSCINWLRTLPYVNAWAEKYRANGLVVVGVHSPEFSFERNIENVRWAGQTLKVDFPIMVDNDHTVWRAFKNLYWPALYIADAQGRIRHHHFGEGGYEQSERIIQQLLAEAGNDTFSRELVSVEARGIGAAADWSNLSSPENYLGNERTENFVSTQGVATDSRSIGDTPRQGLRRNEWTLAGEWTRGREKVVLNRANGHIAYRFHARDLNLVMGPAITGTNIRFRVLIDGKPPGAGHGIDTDEEGNGTAREQRLYQLIRQPGPIVDRLFEIEFLNPGVEAFSFTFG